MKFTVRWFDHPVTELSALHAHDVITDERYGCTLATVSPTCGGGYTATVLGSMIPGRWEERTKAKERAMDLLSVALEELLSAVSTEVEW